jgi:hypothetical protein
MPGVRRIVEHFLELGGQARDHVATYLGAAQRSVDTLVGSVITRRVIIEHDHQIKIAVRPRPALGAAPKKVHRPRL